ncbi:hypothetical protein [Paenibacillus piri]|uniref:Uncharacterized protein n=1 Tax=Paenibacillus piri TaxID=2547395 RepID=A0A4R5KSZ7_9BACL|nr:hypothetical protein [Paenibacillus piri]TDF97987.1 hypothetical protein E1757_10735 [Paenibacillus piri]
MLTYTYDEHIIKIDEIANEADIEFNIYILQEERYLEQFKKVQHYFDHNDIITDVLFYANVNHQYRVIVRSDYYTDFVLELMKHRLLQSVEWQS